MQNEIKYCYVSEKLVTRKPDSLNCFLNVAHPLGVRIPFADKNKNRADSVESTLFLACCKGFACYAGYILGDRCFATVPASDFATKNSSLNCFLNVAHPLGVRIPFDDKNKNRADSVESTLFLACCKGFEPLTFWFVAKHSIQLS